MTSPVIVAARRTPIGTAGHGPLADLEVEELAAPVLATLLADLRAMLLGDTGAPPDGLPVDDVVLGNCMGPGGNVARVSALAAGLAPEVPGLTIDRQCGSGLAAILQAATAVEAGRGRILLAGGVESASRAPERRIDGTPYARARFAPAGYPDPEMGAAADALASAYGVSRARQDAYAARSHARAIAANEAKRFAAEIVPLAGVDTDARPRAGITGERLARLPAAFVPGGTVTAGNSCGVNDGAAAVAVVPDDLGLPGLRLLDWTCVGGDPAQPGIAPVPAIRQLLDRQGLELDDVGAIEFVEAFAGQVLACADALGLDPARICVDGGALALGHPWGASGAVSLVRLFGQLVTRNGPDLGLAAVAVGGGMGIAALVERRR